MKRTWKALAPTILTLAMTLQAAPPPGKGGGNGGGGDDGGGDPSKTPMIARFRDTLADRVVSDGSGDYVDSELGSKGWAELPGTGNFVMQLKGTGRKLELRLRPEDQVGVSEAKAGYPSPVFPGDPFVTELFMSVNRRDCYDPDTGREYLDPGTGEPVPPSECPTGEFRNTGDGLRDMTLNQTIAADIYFSMPDGYKMYCSQDPRDAIVAENPDLDFALVSCDVADAAGVCTKWTVTGADYNPDGDEDLGNDSLLQCGLYQRVGKGKSQTDQHVGDFEMNFSLSLFLDADNNGVPDQPE